MFSRLGFIIVLLLATATMSMAQQSDTKTDDKKKKDEFSTGIKPDSVVKIGKLRYATEPEIEADPNAMHEVDTVLYHIQQMYDTVIAINSRLEDLGNTGSPAFHLDFPPLPAFGFNFGINQWDDYRYTAENIRYFNTQNILTDIYYNQGPTDLRTLNFLHVQNIKRNWSASVQYHGSASQGYYAQQVTNYSNIGVNTMYRSPNNHYMIMASTVWNLFSFQENGGFVNDTLFERASGALAKGSTPTNLLNAYQNFNDQSYTVNQFWFLGTTETREFKKDTSHYVIKVLKPKLYVEHRFNYYQKKYYFRDSAEGPKPFFPGTTNDSPLVADIYRMTDISNRVSIGTALFRDSLTDSTENVNIPFAFSAYAQSDIIRATEDRIDTSFQNFSVGGTIGGAYSLYKLKLDYTLLGYNQGDYLAQAGLNLKISKHLPILSLQATAQQAAPAFIMQRMTSEYFNWNNNFTKQKFYEFQAGLFNILHTDITARYVVAANYVYMGPQIKPVQADTDVDYGNLTIFNHLRFGHFHVNTSFTYQKVLQGDFIHVPNYVLRGSYYFEHFLFKKALLFQGGVDIRYYSSYYGNAYMPGISAFYVQDSFKTGNFPVFDVWVAGKIKRFRFYIKCENIGQILSIGPTQWVVPGYPMSLTTTPFRFGVRWMFFD